MRTKTSSFPVGLYGMLLFALGGLTLPAVFAPLERTLLGAAGQVGRAWTGVVDRRAVPVPDGWHELMATLRADLRRRTLLHDVRTAPPSCTDGFVPVPCRVVAVGGARRGGGGAPAELRLDRTHAELASCRDVVTKADHLVGVLARPGVGIAAADGPDDLARVVLPNHTGGRPLHAEVVTDDGGVLRFVVRAAATVDPAPLRVELWDDPYRAARLDRSGLPVRTRLVPDTVSPLPPDLVVGTTRIWGYPGAQGGAPLTLNVFVVPAVAAHALSHVVVWRPANDADAAPAAAPEPRTTTAAGVVHDVPGAAYGHHLLVGAGDVADGAAVVQDGCLLGTARDLAFGVALVTSFGASRHRWRLLLLPDEPQAAPVEFAGEIVRVDGARVVVRRLDSALGGALRAGHLLTGSNGPHCPPGLWIGRATPAAHDLAELDVVLQLRRGVRGVDVHRGTDLP